MRQYIKPTCVILTAQLLFAAGVLSQPVIKDFFTTEAQTAENKVARKEYGYDTQGLANMANAYQFVDIPPKPTTEGVN